MEPVKIEWVQCLALLYRFIKTGEIIGCVKGGRSKYSVFCMYRSRKYSNFDNTVLDSVVLT